MCDIKESTFFRPWSLNVSTTQSTSTKDAISLEKTISIVKREDDMESVSSSSTLEDHGTSSESEVLTTQSNARIRLRRNSESSFEISSRSCSVESEGVIANGIDMLNNFVFNASTINSSSTSNATSSETSLTRKVPLVSRPAFSMDENLRCLQQAAYHPRNIFHGLQNDTTMMPINMEPTAIQTSTISTTGQPFYYEYPGVHLTQGLYPPSMEHAVEMLHRQDAAAKQMKKLRPKKFRCEHCDVAFSNNGQLKGHIRIHTGERPFKCDAEGCGKSFTRNEELTRHKRIHTGLRPHACLVCGKRFGRKDHLKKHTRTHENRDPYRMSAAALGMFAMGHALPRGHSFPPYVYPI